MGKFMRKKLTIEEVRITIENENYRLISKEYIKNNEKLELLCPKNHTAFISIVNFKFGNRCRICSYEKIGDLKRFPFEKIKKIIEKEGYKVLSTFIKNSALDNIDAICPNGHPCKIHYNNFIKGARCLKCQGRGKLEIEKIISLFLEYGYTPMFSDDVYKKSTARLPYFCNKHLDKGILYVTYSNLSTGKGCKYCGFEKISGENHHMWKGGISPLCEFLRGSLKNWKKESIQNCSFKCVITGERFDDIHHLYPFLNIFNETFNELNIPIYENIQAYSRIELSMLEEKCLEIHKRYPLGVCLKREIHELFHKIYGSKDNTIEQFYEFENDISNGIYNDQLRDAKVDISFLLKKVV